MRRVLSSTETTRDAAMATARMAQVFCWSDLSRGAAVACRTPRATITMLPELNAMSTPSSIFRSRFAQISRHTLHLVCCVLFIGQLAAAPAQTAQPDPANAVQAFMQARAWLDAADAPGASAPGAPGAPAAPPPSHPDVPMAGAILRLNGRVVGMGKCDSPGPGSMADALQQAASNARHDAAVRALGDRPLAALTLELEVGAQPQALVGGTFEETLATLEPAAQGMALRHGERWAFLPASHVLARGMAAPLSRSVLALITELQIPPRDLPELRTGASTAVYAVPSIRLVQSSPTGRPIAIERLTPATSTAPLGDAAVARAAAAIASRLTGQLQEATPSKASEPSPPNDSPALTAAMRDTLARLGLRGAYEPLANEYRDIAASPADQALCAYALARGASCAHWSDAERAAARAAAAQVLAALEAVEPGEVDPRTSATAAAFALLALAELEATPTRPASTAAPARPASTVAPADSVAAPATSPFTAGFTAALTARVRTSLGENTETRALTVADSAAARALALAAAAVRARSTAPVVSPAECSALVAAEWQVLDRKQALVSAPWLLVAERALRASAAPGPVDRIGESREALDQNLAALVGAQGVAMQDRLALPDTWGAYPVTDSTGARATAQSARPMHFVALMQGVCPSTTADGPIAIERSLRSAARFLAQLQCGPDMDFTLRAPIRAHGGIMAAPYDPTMQPAAQGMALLALLEMLQNSPVSTHSTAKPDDSRNASP